MKGSGGMGMMLLMLAIGVGAWALGRTQTDGAPGPGRGGGGSGESGVPPQGHSHSQPQSNGYAGGPAPAQGAAPNAGPAGAGPTAGERPKSSWQRPNPPPGGTGTYTASGTATGRATGTATGRATGTATGTSTGTATGTATGASAGATGGGAKGAWERAREETKKKEEERKAKDAEKKRKEDMEKRIKEAREREAREREAREALAREREKEAREREAREKAKQQETRGSTYAYSAVGERTNPWPNGQPATPTRSPATSPAKKPPAPTAKTYQGTEEAYSYRPYDTPPKKPAYMKSPSSVYSESSYAASQSTARTTPPPSHRGPYSTKDPDKIVLKAVYSFNKAFIKTPSSQLVSGVGSVTDGLILRITTEGLFIDDDVRGVPQREWDVKAWTMKLVEVWCPSFCAGHSASARVAFNSLKHNPVRRLWAVDKEKVATSEETEALLADMLQLCRDNCRSSARSATSSAASSFDDRSSVASDSAYGSSAGSPLPRNHRTNASFSQTGELKSAGLHVLRASIRDQDGKKYLFIISDEESWKIAVGLQRLRKGSQVRALGVSGMSASDAKGTLENLGWT